MENNINKKLWIVSEIFFPEETSTGYYLTEIAKNIAQYQEVNVICGAISYEKASNLKSQGVELPTNIKVFRVNSLSLDKNFLLLRVFRLLYLTISIGSKLFAKTKKGDKVWLVTNPAFLVPIAALLAKLKGFQITILVHDVFPENLIPVNIFTPKNIVFQFLRYVFNKAYSSANQIVVCGRDMALLMEQKIKNEGENSKIKVIENWADIDIIYPMPKDVSNIYKNAEISQKIIFQFAGNIGRLQGLEQLLDIIAQCTNPNLHFVLIGEGALKNTLKTIAINKNILNVSFLDSFNRNQQNAFLNACDVGIVSLYDSMIGLGVPSKSYNIMAAGKPILFLGNKDSEIGIMLNEYDIGWQFELSEREKIIDFLNNFEVSSLAAKGKNARIIAQNKYAKQYILDKYMELLK